MVMLQFNKITKSKIKNYRLFIESFLEDERIVSFLN